MLLAFHLITTDGARAPIFEKKTSLFASLFGDYNSGDTADYLPGSISQGVELVMEEATYRKIICSMSIGTNFMIITHSITSSHAPTDTS